MILIGVVFILDGSKQIVRWTQGIPPLPVFEQLDNSLEVVASFLDIHEHQLDELPCHEPLWLLRIRDFREDS